MKRGFVIETYPMQGCAVRELRDSDYRSYVITNDNAWEVSACFKLDTRDALVVMNIAAGAVLSFAPSFPRVVLVEIVAHRRHPSLDPLMADEYARCDVSELLWPEDGALEMICDLPLGHSPDHVHNDPWEGAWQTQIRRSEGC